MRNQSDHEKIRCSWCTGNDLYKQYHDEEWGVPLHDDSKLFEFLVLESFQSGLSWLTVLKKRENFRKAFDDFDPVKVSYYGEKEIIRLMNDAGIIRNLLKIKAALNNAQRFLEIQHELGSFDRYIWRFVDFKPIVNTWKHLSEVPARTELSDLIAQDMKKKGFKFIGSTVIYSHMQATGMVNDHVLNCYRHNALIYRK